MKLYCLWSEKAKCYMSLCFYIDRIFLSRLDTENNNIGNLFVTTEKLSLCDLPEYNYGAFGILSFQELNIDN